MMIPDLGLIMTCPILRGGLGRYAEALEPGPPPPARCPAIPIARPTTMAATTRPYSMSISGSGRAIGAVLRPLPNQVDRNHRVGPGAEGQRAPRDQEGREIQPGTTGKSPARRRARSPSARPTRRIVDIERPSGPRRRPRERGQQGDRRAPDGVMNQASGRKIRVLKRMLRRHSGPRRSRRPPVMTAVTTTSHHGGAKRESRLRTLPMRAVPVRSAAAWSRSRAYTRRRPARSGAAPSSMAAAYPERPERIDVPLCATSRMTSGFHACRAPPFTPAGGRAATPDENDGRDGRSS